MDDKNFLLSETSESKRMVYPVLPLRDIVIFPFVIASLFVGRERSIRALEVVMKTGQNILLITQKNTSDEDPQSNDMYSVGTLGKILQLLKLPDGTVKVMVEGTRRVEVINYTSRQDYFEASCKYIEDQGGDEVEVEAHVRSAVSKFTSYVKLNKKTAPEALANISEILDPSKLSFTIASHLTTRVSDKQKVLNISSVLERIEFVITLMESEIGVIQAEKRIRSRVKRQMEKTQREYYLNEQIKAIQRELGENGGKDEQSEMDEKIKEARLPVKAKEKVEVELKKLRMMSPMAAEATVVRNYLDWVLSIPWSKKSPIKRDLDFVKKVLDEDHYGLEKVKERIFEYLAVQKRTNSIKGSILCLVGPPGVGKTSLGKSIARATGRKFVRLSLGGVRDEAEIRGHRRTYIGSMPGKIVQSMRKAGKVNPLFLLDEIDKMGVDFRGDPSSALLEVLDPEQNNTFNDHYLELDYDLSNVMFVTTANSLDIPAPLFDRMEVIPINGYSEKEKFEIARRHLIKEARLQHKFSEDEWNITDQALYQVIRSYTKEAGVRGLQRELSKLARKAVTRMYEDEKTNKISVRTKDLPDYLGISKYQLRGAETTDQVGVVSGLAWTRLGGEVLTIEAAIMPGKGVTNITGNLRDVMKESVSASASYVRSRGADFGIPTMRFKKNDIHIHLPEAAIPKDGPSAGISMVTAIVSVMTGIPVRKDLAMTGEVTLRGRVLPVGGVKDKLLAAKRGGAKVVIIPKENERDLVEIDKDSIKGLEVCVVSHMDEVLEKALVRLPKKIEWEPENDIKNNRVDDSKDDSSQGVVTH